jgi:hypothetical protein
MSSDYVNRLFLRVFSHATGRVCFVRLVYCQLLPSTRRTVQGQVSEIFATKMTRRIAARKFLRLLAFAATHRKSHDVHRYNRAKSTPSAFPRSFITSLRLATHHSSIASTNVLTSATLFPACKQSRTLCVPSGTVGGTTALTIIPLFCRNAANRLGSCNWIEKMGLCWHCVGIRRRDVGGDDAAGNEENGNDDDGGRRRSFGCRSVRRSYNVWMRTCRCPCKGASRGDWRKVYAVRIAAREG